MLRRPETLDAGVKQLRDALAQTTPTPDSHGPRARLWRACDALFRADAFVDSVRVLYDANAIVSFLFNTLVPCVEERLRYDTLEQEHARALDKPDAVTQNGARFLAMLDAVAAAEATSRANPRVESAFCAMRDGLSPLHADATARDGLGVLYVSSKLARKAIDMILQRLMDAYQNDTSVVPTTDIPWEAMMLR